MITIIFKSLVVFSLFIVTLTASFIFALQGYWPYTEALKFHDILFNTGPGVDISLAQQLENDLGGTPWRRLVTRSHRPNPNMEPIDFAGLSPNAEKPVIFLSADAPKGFRVIIGSFGLKDGGFDAAVLIDSDGAVRHWWRLMEDPEMAIRPERNRFPHGFLVLPDGSALFAMDGGNSLNRIDVCSHPIWAREGEFHHSIARADDGNIWTWDNYWMVKIDPETGETIKRLHPIQISRANPDIDIFGLRQTDHLGESKWTDDFWHPNDVEPLPAQWADAYPDFDAGDLLVSLRSINLVFVVSPETMKIKWWRIGDWRRQHDPDWGPDGRILVYDNNMHRGVSRIVSLDPRLWGVETVVDGETYDFYSEIRGKVQQHSGGSILVTSSQQGRAFELNSSGEIQFDFESVYSPEHNFQISEAQFLEENYFDFDEFPKCTHETEQQNVNIKP